MKKIWRWLKKNRYYIIGVALFSAIGLMAFIGVTASNNNEDVIVLPTETAIPYTTPTYTLPPYATPIPPHATPTATTGGQVPYPTLIWPEVPHSTPILPLIPTPTPNVDASLYAKCDVNCDGRVDRVDVMQIFFKGMNRQAQSLCGIAKVDTNGNGRIDLPEVTYCFQVVY